MGRVVQVLITHNWNVAFTTDVDEYVKKIFNLVSKNDIVLCKVHLAFSKLGDSYRRISSFLSY